MNFRDCVIDCIAEGELVQSFNRLHDARLTPELLGRLKIAQDDELCLADLDETQQELLACFILFVHRHIWRKVKLAEARVTRANDDRTLGLNLTRLESGGGFDSQLQPPAFGVSP